MLLTRASLVAAAVVVSLTGVAQAGVSSVSYTVDAGGNNSSPLNGLKAAATFFTMGTTLTINLSNTSTGVPAGFDSAASLLTTLAFNLPAGVTITMGNSALIAAGSTGFGGWAARTAGASVGDDWLWTNAYGGDLLNAGQPNASRQVISTMEGNGNPPTFRFDGLSGSINGPKGGIAAAPPVISTGGLYGVSNKIAFTLTLSRALTDAELAAVTGGSVVEFGSDARYLRIPAPGAAALGLGALGLIARRRRA